MKENIIVLPGTRWQIPLIKKLKNRGFYVVVLDYYENQPAYEYGDEYRVVDILDKEKVLEIAKEYDVLAVISDECDIATPTIAWVSEQLHKPSIGMDMAELYTNKYKMRKFGQENGFSVPIFFKCSCVEEAIVAFRSFGRKMIMKPLDANSSRGVFSIVKEIDIIKNFSKTIAYSKKEKCVLLEEYIEGEEFSIDAIKIENQVFSMAISKKEHFPYNENLDQALFFKYQDDKFDYTLLKKINTEYIKKTKIPFGLTHAEYKYCNGQYYMIEIGARGGGNLISSIINPCITGIESQELLIDWAIGKKMSQDCVKYAESYKERCATLYFFDAEGKEGVLKEIKGLEFLDNFNEIKSYHFFYQKGQSIKKAEDGGTRVGYYIACCESEEKLKKINYEIMTKVELVIG